MNRFSIKDIENLTGIKAHTLRIWEQRHGIIIPKRTETNIRYYDDEDLKKALKIALLNQYGYKISRIQKMTDEEINTLLRETVDKGFQFDYLLNTLLEATIDMDTEKFEFLVNKYIRKFGIEQTIEQLIFRFMEKIGILWMTDRILPAQEHLISNIITRKVLLATEKLPVKTDFNKKSFLLFLPSGEIHELGLLYIQYLLVKHNKHVIYLGSDAPLDQVILVCKKLEPDHLYTHITSPISNIKMETYLNEIADVQPKSKLFVSGSMLQNLNKKSFRENVVFITSLDDIKSIFNKML